MKQGIVTGRIAALSSRPDFWLAGLLLWILLSAGRSWGTPWAAAALTEALRWSAGIGIALAVGWYLRPIVLAGQFLVTLVGAMALIGMLDSGNPAESGLVGPYHDHQLYGSVLLLLLPFSAGTALTARQEPWRWGAYAAGASGTLCLFLCQTRSAWLGLVAAVLVFGWLWLSRTAHRPHRWRVVLVPAILLLLGLFAVWQLNGPADQRQALTHRAATLTALSQDGSWQSRLELWRGTAHLMEAHPIFGIGLGRYPGEQWRWTHSGGFLAPTERPSLTNEAHSFYGQTAAETGLTGLSLYLAALTAFAVQALRRLRKSRRHLSAQSTLLIAALSALAGQGVDALASPSWQFPEVSFFFWAVLGIGLASLRREESQTAPTPVPYPVRRLGQWAISGSVAVVLAAQILPIGLLTPVEAYDHPASDSFKSVSISSTSCSSGSGLCFALTGYYSIGSTDLTFDNGGATRIPATFKCTVAPSTVTPCISKFGSGDTRNQLTVSRQEVGKPLYISGSFEDGASSNGKITYSGYASPAITVTP